MTAFADKQNLKKEFDKQIQENHTYAVLGLADYQDEEVTAPLECPDTDPEVLQHTNENKICENFKLKKLIVIQETALESVYKSKFNTKEIR